MTGEDLKKAVLQAAVQGKICAQKEPFSTVKRELESLQCDIQYPSEPPFEIPESWAWVRAGEIGDWKAGATPKKGVAKYFEGGTVPWLMTGDLNDGHIISTSKFVTETALQECSLRLNPVGSVLVAMYGATIGKVGILDIEATTNQACCACILKNEKMQMWLYTWLLFQKPFFQAKGEGSAQPNISKKKIVESLIPIPPIEEQERIVAKLDEIMPLVEEYGRLQEQRDKLDAELPEKIRKAVLQTSIQGKLVKQLAKEGTAEASLSNTKKEPAPDVEAVPFEIPSGWKWYCLGQVVNIRSARRVHKHDWRSSGVPFYRAREVVKLSKGEAITEPLYIDESLYQELAESGLPKAGDLLVTGVGTIGTSYIVKAADRFYYKDASVLCFENRCGILPEYLHLVMGSDFMIGQVREASGGTTVGTITMKNAVKFLIPIPPIEEQERIVAKLDEVMPLVNGLVV